VLQITTIKYGYNLYVPKWKTMTKGTSENLIKGTDLPGSRGQKFYIIKVFILSKLLYEFNTTLTKIDFSSKNL
jgi:hypothetical protein